MRRQNRYMLNGALLAGGVVGIFDIILQWLEARENEIQFTWETYSLRRTLKNTAWGAGAGATAGYLYYKMITDEEAIEEFDSEKYLQQVLRAEDLKSDRQLYETLKQKKEEIKKLLYDCFSNRLVAYPQDSGSFFTQTAIGSNFDLDVILPMKKEAYGTLEEMYNEVFDIITEKFKSYATVIRQTKAIGLKLNGTDNNDIYIDIVPGREIDCFLKDGKLNLYKNPKWIWQKGSSFKIDLSRHGKPYPRKVENTIKLIKIYRDRNNLNIPSVLIDQAVNDGLAANNYGISYLNTENLTNAMEHLAYKLDLKKFNDNTNSNNNLNNKMPSDDRSYLTNFLLKDLEKIEKNERYLKEAFLDS